MNAIVRDGVDGVAKSGVVAALRVRLWSEHLGSSTRALQRRPEAGWLPAWRKRADKNVVALDTNDSRHRYRGFVLPYSVCATPAGQWLDMGIQKRDNSPDLRFKPNWMEVYFSPNWVRNMFL